jgi:hypothetical protein
MSSIRRGIRRGNTRLLVAVVRRLVVRVGLVAGLGLDLSFDLGHVLLHLSEIVVRQHHRMPKAGLGHGPSWTIGLACQMGGGIFHDVSVPTDMAHP